MMLTSSQGTVSDGDFTSQEPETQNVGDFSKKAQWLFLPQGADILAHHSSIPSPKTCQKAFNCCAWQLLCPILSFHRCTWSSLMNRLWSTLPMWRPKQQEIQCHSPVFKLYVTMALTIFSVGSWFWGLSTCCAQRGRQRTPLNTNLKILITITFLNVMKIPVSRFLLWLYNNPCISRLSSVVYSIYNLCRPMNNESWPS